MEFRDLWFHIFTQDCQGTKKESNYNDWLTCNTNGLLAFINDLIIILLIWQIYFVNYKCYGIPIIQRCGQSNLRTTDHRQHILIIVFISSVYNVVHYQIMPKGNRSKLYSVIEIFRTNILLLVIYYYLRMASEEILKRHVYLIYKTSLKIYFIFINSLMIVCGIIIYHRINIEKTSGNKLCIELEFQLYRWGSAITSIIFLILALHL